MLLIGSRIACAISRTAASLVAAEQRDLGRSYDLGVNSYVRKPIEFAEFSDAVRQLGLYWLLLNEPPPDSSA